MKQSHSRIPIAFLFLFFFWGWGGGGVGGGGQQLLVIILVLDPGASDVHSHLQQAALFSFFEVTVQVLTWPVRLKEIKFCFCWFLIFQPHKVLFQSSLGEKFISVLFSSFPAKCAVMQHQHRLTATSMSSIQVT